MTNKRLKVHITGMGGQGIGSTSRILREAATIAGLAGLPGLAIAGVAIYLTGIKLYNK